MCRWYGLNSIYLLVLLSGCTADNKFIKINGKGCVDLLTGSDGLSHCDSSLVTQYCCKVSRLSRIRSMQL